MEFTAIWNWQRHPIHILVALYKDDQFFTVILPSRRALNLDARILEQAQISLFDTEEGLEERISLLPRTFRQVPFRMS